MNQRPCTTTWLVTLLGVALLAFPLTLPATDVSAGEGLGELETSLKFVPDDAEMYASLIGFHRYMEAIEGSRAWARLVEMPLVQMGLEAYREQAADPDDPLGQFDRFLSSPQGQELLALLREMVADEVFLYGRSSAFDMGELILRLENARSYGPMVRMMTGDFFFVDPMLLQVSAMVEAAAEHRELIKAPELVLGFRVRTTQRAVEHIGKLEVLLGALAEQEPALRGRVDRTEIGDARFLTLTLDGSMIPIEDEMLEDLRDVMENEEALDVVLEAVRDLELVITVGLRDDYLLLATGPSTEIVAALGTAPLLVDRPEMQRLAPYADHRVSSISFAEGESLRRVDSNRLTVEAFVDTAGQLIDHAELDAELAASLRADLTELRADLDGLLPIFGTVAAIGFLDGAREENYSFTWVDVDAELAAAPLGLLSHLGGSPLIAAVGREADFAASYELLAKWAGKGFGYLDALVEPMMEEADREVYRDFVASLIPLADRFDAATRQLILPSLGDESATVVDSAVSSRQPHVMLPPDQDLPLPEVAVVLTVSDTESFLEGLEEYRQVFNALIEALREGDPHALPDLRIGEPEVSPIAGGTRYALPLPPEWGFDREMLPNLAIGEEVAAFSITAGHGERLLAATPLESGGALADPARPMSQAAVVDWAGTVESLRPWVGMAADAILDQLFFLVDDPQPIRQQVETVIDLLTVVRSMTTATYVEEGVAVSHAVVEYGDID